MNAASLASLTVGLSLVCIEVYAGFCKAVYSNGAKLIVSTVNAAMLVKDYNVPVLHK